MSESNEGGAQFLGQIGTLDRVRDDEPLDGELRAKDAGLSDESLCTAKHLSEYACGEQERSILGMDLSAEGVLSMMGASEEELASFKAAKAELSSEEVAAICRRQGVPEHIITQQ